MVLNLTGVDRVGWEGLGLTYVGSERAAGPPRSSRAALPSPPPAMPSIWEALPSAEVPSLRCLRHAVTGQRGGPGWASGAPTCGSGSPGPRTGAQRWSEISASAVLGTSAGANGASSRRGRAGGATWVCAFAPSAAQAEDLQRPTLVYGAGGAAPPFSAALGTHCSGAGPSLAETCCCVPPLVPSKA